MNLLVGRVANQIGNLLAPQLSLDQLSVSQAELSQAAATIGASSLQVEFGRYVRDNVFLKGVYQRGYCADPTLPVNSGGARVEVEMPRDVTLEGFFENRCTREGLRGLGGLSLDRAWIWGTLLLPGLGLLAGDAPPYLAPTTRSTRKGTMRDAIHADIRPDGRAHGFSGLRWERVAEQARRSA